MVSIIIHAVLGVAVVVAIVVSNPQIFRAKVTGPPVSALEALYYAAGIGSLPFCWYWNIQFVNTYAPDGVHNAIWGPGSWAQFIALGYDNPAASSASLDYTIMSVILLPFFAIVDGRRRGINRPWLHVLALLVTSSAFAWAFYLVTVERQRRVTANQPVPTG